MNQHTIDLVNKQGLQFFGSVNASISHELKNIFAIISETAGFLNDLTQLSKQGKKLELSVLENCSNSIAEEIERGFDTIRQMNQFAHSVDDPVRETRIADTLALAAKLTGFLSYAKKAHIQDGSAGDVTVFTSPFLFQTLVYKTLCALYKAMDTKDALILSYQVDDPSGVTLVFSCDRALDLKDFPDPKTADVADALKATFTIKESALELTIPRDNDGLQAALADGQTP
jgi:signal transduction histidine kinase